MTSTSYLNPSNALTLVRGTTKTIALTVLDEAGDAFDLTGATIWFTMKKVIADEAFVVQKKSDVSTEIAIMVAKEGTCEIYLLPADTQLLDVREYVFDIWVVTAAGARYLVSGPSTLELQNSVTRIQ